MSTTEARVTSAFRVYPIPPATLAGIRLAGRDQFGHTLIPIVDDGGSPLRCCLRRSTPGEVLYLIAYCPFSQPGPYAETGPVFVHASACAGYTDNDLYPAGYRDWPPMIFRPYRHDARLNCDVIAYEAIKMGDGVVAESLLASMFTDPTINFIHTRNVNAGCFMFTVTAPTLNPPTVLRAWGPHTRFRSDLGGHRLALSGPGGHRPGTTGAPGRRARNRRARNRRRRRESHLPFDIKIY